MMRRRNRGRTTLLAAAVLLSPGEGGLLRSSAEAQTAISADGVVESTSGGFKFPDGSIQLTAAGSTEACPTVDPSDEMVWVGGVCVDKYEASVWDAPIGGNQITGPIPCSATGQDCKDQIFARSVAGVEPRHGITWFQAQAALANSGKRLPSSAEWQMAAQGTPDHPGPCNTDTGSVEPTGSRLDCTSDWGSLDMVGNVWEWAADWVPRSTVCPGWGAFSDDLMCLAGASESVGPAALVRGGGFFSEAGAGAFAVDGFSFFPSSSSSNLGFRGAR